jgi:hypothetical protein
LECIEKIKSDPKYILDNPQILVDIFTHHRQYISDLLNTVSDYDDLVVIFNNICATGNKYTEQIHQVTPYPLDIAKYEMCGRLLLGFEGYEHNKQSTLYTLPTTEFMNVVYSIQVILDKYNVVELFSGMGLFSNMYNKFALKKQDSGFPQTNMVAYDSGTWLETSFPHKYFPVEVQSIEKCIIDNTQHFNDVCVALMPHKLEKYLKIFLDVCNPACLIVVVPLIDVEKYTDVVRTTSYKYTVVNVKMISYLDYFGLPQCESCNHTTTIIIARNIIPQQSIDMVTKEILMSGGTIILPEANSASTEFASQKSVFVNDIDEETKIINDCVCGNMFPQWMAFSSPAEKKEILHLMRQIFLSRHTRRFIRDNIGSLDDLKEYIAMKPHPINNCTHEKFVEYKKIYNCLKNLDDLHSMQERGVFPEWIQTLDDAYTYLYLDYTDINKTWKENEHNFRNYIGVA